MADLFTLAPAYGQASTFTYTGTAGTSSALSGGTRVLLWCTTDAYVMVGASATATATSLPIPAYTPVILPVGSGARVSAVQISTSGSCYFIPLGDS